MNDFGLNDNTNFWLYTTKQMHWQQLEKLIDKNILHLGCYHKANIEKNDIIFMYLKDNASSSKKNGFIAILVSDGKINDNKTFETKIFNDKYMNRFYVILSKITLLTSTVKLIEISNDIKKAYPEYGNDIAFRKTYMTMENDFNILPKKMGKNLVTILLDATERKTNPDTEIEEEINMKIKSDSNEIPNSDSSKNKYKHEQSDNESYNSYASKTSSDSNKSDDSENSDSDNDNIFNESSDNESSSESNSDNSKEHITIDGHIPIIMIPCVHFKWKHKTTEELLREFKKHYGKCERCSVTNNNNSELGLALPKANVIYREKKDGDSLTKIIKKYFNLKPYKFNVPKRKHPKSPIYIFRVNDKTHIYHNCFIIVW